MGIALVVGRQANPSKERAMRKATYSDLMACGKEVREERGMGFRVRREVAVVGMYPTLEAAARAAGNTGWVEQRQGDEWELVGHR